MADITDTLIIIQIKAFIKGQGSAVSHAIDDDIEAKGYAHALADLSVFIDDLQAKANQIGIDTQMAMYPTVRAYDCGDNDKWKDLGK